jgi:hypothetical protein
MRPPRQLDLFAPKPRNHDEAVLVRVLLRAARGQPEPQGVMVGKVGRMSRAAIRRLMTPLPPITVPW